MPKPVLLLLAAAALGAGCGGPDATQDSLQSAADPLTRTAATLVAAPDPVAARQTLHLSGCGYSAGQAIFGEDWGPQGVEEWGGWADAKGCLSQDRSASAFPGGHTLKAYQQLKRGQRSLMAKANLTITPAPLSLVSEDYFFRWDATKACVSEDDNLNWSAAGSLAPGQSFSFTPRYPDCDDPRAVMVRLVADSGARLRLSTVVPLSDGISNDPGQAGRTIAVDTSGGQASLCMFPNSSYSAPAAYTITVTNVGTTTAASVEVTGRDYNDWPYYFWSACLASDADRDGWSDSYEHTMALLVYPTGNSLSGALPAGSDYLRGCGSAQPGDEFDFLPTDLDDDGAVTAADVGLVEAHLGEGNGVPWSAISPNPGVAQWYWNHVGAWNRFDLDADGLVGASDVAVVTAALGARCAP